MQVAKTFVRRVPVCRLLATEQRELTLTPFADDGTPLVKDRAPLVTRRVICSRCVMAC